MKHFIIILRGQPVEVVQSNTLGYDFVVEYARTRFHETNQIVVREINCSQIEVKGDQES